MTEFHFTQPLVGFFRSCHLYSVLLVGSIQMVSWWFVGWIIALLLTPGPTNTLLASSGLRVGIAKSFPLIPAEAFGYLISISLWGFAVGILSQHLYMLPDFLKLFSAIYIAYLASQLWCSSSNPDNEQPIKIGARQ